MRNHIVFVQETRITDMRLQDDSGNNRLWEASVTFRFLAESRKDAQAIVDSIIADTEDETAEALSLRAAEKAAKKSAA